MKRLSAQTPFLLLLLMIGGCGGQAPRRESIAAELAASRRMAQPIAPPSRTYGEFPLEEAYRVQEALVRRLSASGDEAAGYKVAFTSGPTQKAFGVAEPAYGRLMSSMRMPDGATIDVGEFIRPVVELEVAFIIGTRIDRPPADVPELKRHVKTVHAALDLADVRFAEGKGAPTAADVIADVAGARLFILGAAADPRIDLDKVSVALTHNGTQVYHGPATAAMGGPWNVLLWLSRKLAERGAALEAGDVILTGALDRPFTGDGSSLVGEFVGDCGPLGRVSCKFAAPVR